VRSAHLDAAVAARLGGRRARPARAQLPPERVPGHRLRGGRLAVGGGAAVGDGGSFSVFVVTGSGGDGWEGAPPEPGTPAPPFATDSGRPAGARAQADVNCDAGGGPRSEPDTHVGEYFADRTPTTAQNGAHLVQRARVGALLPSSPSRTRPPAPLTRGGRCFATSPAAAAAAPADHRVDWLPIWPHSDLTGCQSPGRPGGRVPRALTPPFPSNPAPPARSARPNPPPTARRGEVRGPLRAPPRLGLTHHLRWPDGGAAQTSDPGGMRWAT
jgi:hypothetical protein